MAEKTAQGVSMAALAKEPPPSYDALQAYNQQPPLQQYVPTNQMPPPGDFPMAAVGGTPNPGGYPYYAPPSAIVEEWVSPAPAVNDCPYGMENLIQMDKIVVHPVSTTCTEYRGYQSSSKYAIRNQYHNRAYFAAEESHGCCSGGICQLCNDVFDIKLADQTGTVLLHFSRPCSCLYCALCCPCFALRKMTITTGGGTVLGYVDITSLWSSTLSILNAQNGKVLKVKGPGINKSEWLTKSVKEFMISTGSGANIGSICKMWDTYNRDITGYDNGFNINCPVDLDVKMKACLIGAAFLMDHHFFSGSAHPQR